MIDYALSFGYSAPSAHFERAIKRCGRVLHAPDLESMAVSRHTLAGASLERLGRVVELCGSKDIELCGSCGWPACPEHGARCAGEGPLGATSVAKAVEALSMVRDLPPERIAGPSADGCPRRLCLQCAQVSALVPLAVEPDGSAGLCTFCATAGWRLPVPQWLHDPERNLWSVAGWEAG